MTEKRVPKPEDFMPASPDKPFQPYTSEDEAELSIQEKIAANILDLLKKPVVIGDDGLPLRHNADDTTETIEGADVDFSFRRKDDGLAEYEVTTRLNVDGRLSTRAYQFDLGPESKGKVVETSTGPRKDSPIEHHIRNINDEDYAEALHLSNEALKQRAETDLISVEGFDKAVREQEEREGGENVE